MNKLHGKNDDLGILNCSNLLHVYPYLYSVPHHTMDMYSEAPTIAHLLTFIILKLHHLQEWTPDVKVWVGNLERKLQVKITLGVTILYQSKSFHSHVAIQCIQISLFLLNMKMNKNIVESKAHLGEYKQLVKK